MVNCSWVKLIICCSWHPPPITQHFNCFFIEFVTFMSTSAQFACLVHNIEKGPLVHRFATPMPQFNLIYSLPVSSPLQLILDTPQGWLVPLRFAVEHLHLAPSYIDPLTHLSRKAVHEVIRHLSLVPARQPIVFLGLVLSHE